MSLRKGLVRKMRFFCRKVATDSSFEVMSCRSVRLKGLINLRNFGGVKFPVARTPRAKKWSKIKKLPFLSQKRVQPAICPKALHRGSETSLQHTNAVQAPLYDRMPFS